MAGAVGVNLMASSNENADVNGRNLYLRSAGKACVKEPALLFFKYSIPEDEILATRLLLFHSFRMLVEEPDGTIVVTDGQWRGDAETYNGWLMTWGHSYGRELVMISRQWHDFTKAGKHVIRVFCCAGDRVQARRSMSAEGQELEQLLGAYEWKSNAIEMDVMPCTSEVLKRKATELLELSSRSRGRYDGMHLNWNTSQIAPARALSMFGHSAAIGPLKELYGKSVNHHLGEGIASDIPVARRLAMEGLLRIGTTDAIETLSSLETLSRDEAILKKELLGYVLSRTESGDHHLSFQNAFEGGAIDVAKRSLKNQGGDLLLRSVGKACAREPVLLFLSEYPRFRDKEVLLTRLLRFHSLRMLVEEPGGTKVVTDGQWREDAESNDGGLMTGESSVGGRPDELVMISRQWHDFAKVGQHLIRVFCCAGDRVQSHRFISAEELELEQLLGPYEWKSNVIRMDVVPCSDDNLERKARDLLELSLGYGTRRYGQSLNWDELKSTYVYDRALSLFGHPAAIWPLEELHHINASDDFVDPLARKLAMEGLLRIGTWDAIETLSTLETLSRDEAILKRKLLGYVLSRMESGGHHLFLQNAFESGAIKVAERFLKDP